MPSLQPRKLTIAAAAVAGLAATGWMTPAGAHPQSASHQTQGLTARTIFTGTSHGWSKIDDVTSVGNDLYVSFQNGVPSTGGTTGTPTMSTIVKLALNGKVEASWQVVGKCDGLTADARHDRVIATVNEDGNSSLYTVPTEGTASPTHYSYDANPLPHGGGTDSITIYRGGIYVVASAPATGGPALYRITLHDGVAHLAAAPFYDSSVAQAANGGATGSVTLALTDPDSSTTVPSQSPRFGGDFMLDAQGDQQAVFAAHLGKDNQKLQVLNLTQSVDDTAFATGSDGILVATDSTANSVVLISGDLHAGAAYTAVTPGNANSAPPSPGPNYLGVIDLNSGVVSPIVTSIPALAPHGLIYVSEHH